MAVKITKAQRELLAELKERGRFADYLDQRTLKALIQKGLASIYGYTPGGDDAKAHITPAGNESLEDEIERQAAALWRSDHPDASVFSCDHKTKEKYRQKIRDRSPSPSVSRPNLSTPETK